MAQQTINMNIAKQVYQLSIDGVGINETVRRTGISKKTVKKYLRMLQLLPKPADGEHGIERSGSGVEVDEDCRRDMHLHERPHYD